MKDINSFMTANQWIGFSMMGTSVIKELQEYVLSNRWFNDSQVAESTNRIEEKTYHTSLLKLLFHISTTQLLYGGNVEENIARREYISVIYMDLSKNFQKLNYYLLIAKLGTYWFEIDAKGYMKNYLTYRK